MTLSSRHRFWQVFILYFYANNNNNNNNLSPILPVERAFFLDYVDKKDPINSLIEPDVLQFQHDGVGDEQMVFTEGFHSFVRIMPRHRCSDHPETTSMIAKINNTLQILCVKRK